MIKLAGNLYLNTYPFWLTYKPKHHKVKGTEVRQIIENIKVGDILLQRHDGYISTIAIPGFWCHAAIYIGGGKIIHAVGQGVCEEDLLDFCRCDSICILRVNDEDKESAIKIAHQMKTDGLQYDYKFQSDDGQTVYCTEFVDRCYNGRFHKAYGIVAGNNILTPDGMRNSQSSNMVIEFIH